VFSRKYSIAILGAGNGGLALAGYLAQQGHPVSLWSRSPARIFPIAALGGIRLGLRGSKPSLAPLRLATCNIGAALAGAQRVIVAVPASGHAEVARKCARHLRDGQTVLLLPGRTGGALEFRRVLRSAGCQARILLGEANTFPFASRATGPTSAVIHGIKTDVCAAALPASRTPELLELWWPVLPVLSAAQSVLETGLANLGAILHPVITLLNAERIESKASFDFYADGVTASVADALAEADAERLSIASEYGVPACSLLDWLGAAYGRREDNIRSAVCGNPAYVGIKAPTTLEHRYLLEDVPTGLIPLIELGRAAGLRLPTLRKFAGLAGAALGGQPWQQPRTLRALGLHGLGIDEIRALVERDRLPLVNRLPWGRSTRVDALSVPSIPRIAPTSMERASA
jgi:opine dehydrogenase